MQEAEYAEMLKARLESGKSASTSASGTGEAGIDENSIFADLDLDGTLPCYFPCQTQDICMVIVQAHITGFAGCYSTSTTATHIIPSLATMKMVVYQGIHSQPDSTALLAQVTLLQAHLSTRSHASSRMLQMRRCQSSWETT